MHQHVQAPTVRVKLNGCRRLVKSEADPTSGSDDCCGTSSIKTSSRSPITATPPPVIGQYTLIGKLVCRWRGRPWPSVPRGCCLQFPFPEENPQLAELLADHADEECLAMRPDPGGSEAPITASSSSSIDPCPSRIQPAAPITIIGPQATPLPANCPVDDQMRGLLGLVHQGFVALVPEESSIGEPSIEVLLSPECFESLADDNVAPRKHHHALKQLMYWVFPPLVQAIGWGLDPAEAHSWRSLDPTPAAHLPGREEAQGPLQEEELFDSLHYDGAQPLLNAAQQAALAPLVLRPYQQRAVAWMLRCEGRVGRRLSPLWLRCQPCGQSKEPFYLNLYTGFLARSPPLVCEIRGGILADEMGLGKTVEAVACVLLRRRPLPPPSAAVLARLWGYHQPSGQPNLDSAGELVVRCGGCGTRRSAASSGYQHYAPPPDLPHLCGPCTAEAFPANDECGNQLGCTSDQSLLHSGATLLVCPSSILPQWQRELEKHVAKRHQLRVMVYPGSLTTTVSISDGGRRRRVHVKYLPCHLACHDIVLTTYEALRPEVHKVAEGPPMRLRNAAAVAARWVRSPLVGVHWWRVVLDESQLVEGPTSMAGALASMLSAQHRWCVTGTPLRGGIQDLQGLLRFLQAEPFDEPRWWRATMLEPCVTGQPPGGRARLLGFLKGIMWRTSKDDVLGTELELPPQIVHRWALRFSPVEQYYYDKLAASCKAECQRLLGRLGPAAPQGTAREEQAVGGPLLRLRQACCHPQVGAAPGLVALQKCTMSMEDLRQHMVGQARVECEEALREAVMARLGTAAVHWLIGTPEALRQAAAIYRQVLAEAAQGDSGEATAIRVDPLPRLHAAANLLDLLRTHSAVVGRSLRDEGLETLIKNIRDDATAKAEVAVAQARQKVEEESRRAAAVLAAAVGDGGGGGGGGAAPAGQWLPAVLLAESRRPQSTLLDRVVVTLEVRHVGRLFHTLQGFHLWLTQQIEALLAARRSVLAALQEFSRPPTEADVTRSRQCPACNPGTPGALCRHCLAERQLLAYQQLIMAKYTSASSHSANAQPSRTDLGNRDPSELMRLLRVVAQFVQHTAGHRSDPGIAQGAEKALAAFAALRAEYVACRALWSAQSTRLQHLGELSAAAGRLQYRAAAAPEQAGTIAAGTEEHHLNKYHSQAVEAELQLHRRLGHLKFLVSRCVRATDQCTVCFGDVGAQPVLLGCGHAFCSSCVMRMQEGLNPSARWLMCPICRSRTHLTQLCYVPDLEANHPSQQSSSSSSSLSSPQQNPNGGVEQERPANREGSSSQAGEAAFLARPLEGDWGTKLGAVVRLLVAIGQGLFDDTDSQGGEAAADGGDAGPSAPKAVVFSQWPDALTLLARALERNGLPHALGLQPHAMQAALRQFRDASSGVGVLLLPLSTGARGLNLTEATHVVLVEPVLAPEAYAQAIGRVHRIGQTRPTHVHLFVIQDTVEVDICRLHAHRTHAGNGAAARVAPLKRSNRLSLPEIRSLLTGGPLDSAHPVPPSAADVLS